MKEKRTRMASNLIKIEKAQTARPLLSKRGRALSPESQMIKEALTNSLDVGDQELKVPAASDPMLRDELLKSLSGRIRSLAKTMVQTGDLPAGAKVHIRRLGETVRFWVTAEGSAVGPTVDSAAWSVGGSKPARASSEPKTPSPKTKRGGARTRTTT